MATGRRIVRTLLAGDGAKAVAEAKVTTHTHTLLNMTVPVLIMSTFMYSNKKKWQY